MSGIGTLTRVPNIRHVWRGEEADFTPWLAQPENLAVLADAMGFGPDGLDLVGVEVALPGGGYHADIVARVTGSAEGDLVLIENQFGKSDHDHLGKLLTYSSGLKARTVVLIGETIRTEHRAALDWMNTITNADHGFFACEIELWRINDSLPAPRFNVVVQPNDWSREKAVDPRPLTEGQKRLLRFWQLFEEKLGESSKRVRPAKAQPANWLSHSVGRTGCLLNSSVKFAENWVRGEIYLTGRNADAFYRQLVLQRDEIERDFGQPLDWYDAAERDRRISIRREFPGLANEANWGAAHRWLAETLDKLHATFSPRIRLLEAVAETHTE